MTEPSWEGPPQVGGGSFQQPYAPPSGPTGDPGGKGCALLLIGVIVAAGLIGQRIEQSLKGETTTPSGPTPAASLPEQRSSLFTDATVAIVETDAAAIDREAQERQERFQAMSPREHAAEANRLLDQGCDRSDGGVVDQAAEHFRALPERMQNGSRGRRITDRIARCMLPDLRRLTRERNAQWVWQTMLQSGADVALVRAQGEDSTTLHIVSRQCSAAFAQELASDFQRLMRRDGYRVLECQQRGILGSSWRVTP